MKIAFFEVRADEKKLLIPLLAGNDVQYFSDFLSIDTVKTISDIEVLGVFVGSQVRKEVIDALPQLKLIVTRSTGFDHIDLSYAQQKGIAVATVPAYGTHTVAEFTFALLLAISRKMYDAVTVVRKERHFMLDNLKGFDLYGKTLGIIGTGKIGKNVAIIAKSFGMKVIATDAYPDITFASAQGMIYMELPQLLAQADIISVHVPYMKETHHLLDAQKFSLMKKGAVLINTARGEIVESKALVDALKSGTIGAAGLDVMEDERAMNQYDKELMDMPNVLITPHVAFFTNEAEASIIETTVANIQAFSQGKAQNLAKMANF